MSGSLIITHGLPASGKSTWAEEQVRLNPAKAVRVNRDDIRTVLFGEEYHSGSFPQKSEAEVTQVSDALIREYLADGREVYVDNTNLNPKNISQLVDVARELGAEVKQEYFNVPVEECKRRNKLRAEAGGRDVPDSVFDFMSKLGYSEDGNIKEFIIEDDGKVYAVSRETEGMKLLENFSNELNAANPMQGKAVAILDIDGSLFNNEKDARRFLHNQKKKNYHGFYTSIEKAPVNETVLNLANSMRENDGINIVVVTGRSDDYASHLIEAVRRSGVKASRVIMKRKDDYRASSKHKRDTVKRLRDEGFVVVHAIDDREQDLAMFKSLGVLTTTVESVGDNFDAEPTVTTIYGTGRCIRCGQALKNGGNIGPKCKTKM